MRTELRIIRILLLALLLVLVTSTAPVAAEPMTRGIIDKIIARSHDAYVAFDASTHTWEIGTAGIARRMDYDPGGGYRLVGLLNKLSGREWLAPSGGPSAELRMMLDGKEIIGASPEFVFKKYSTRTTKDGALELQIQLARESLIAHFYYVAFPRSNVIEQWVAIENTGSRTLRNLSVLDSFSVTLQPSGDPLTIYHVAGAAPSFTKGEEPQPLPSLRLHSKTLVLGESEFFGSNGRSSQESIGWFVLAAPNLREGLWGALEWSGPWEMSAWRTTDATNLRAGIREIRHDLAPGEVFHSPRRIVGFYRGDLEDARNATHEFARKYLVPTRPANFPWTQYNSWFAHYLEFDENLLKREVDLAAALGLEVFVLDAGWYEGAPNVGSDFSLGLGTWREDRKKFPSGLRAFSDYVHNKGMKFGLWVEPERIDLNYAGPGKLLPYSWLMPGAQGLANAGDTSTAQVCLGNPEARAWMKQWLSRLVRDYRVDWFVWDYNIYMSCDSTDEPGYGNYSHVMGLYEVLDYLREKFPHLIIENCASGGNRMDYGLLRRTQIAWMSDETDLSYRVRYHFAGASYPFPPEYLNSSLVESYFEPLARASDPRQFQGLVRSHQLGAFQVAVRLETLTVSQRALLATEVQRYKSTRETIARGRIFHLLPQTDLKSDLEPPVKSEAAQYYNEANKNGIVVWFQGATPVQGQRLMLKGLDENTRYRVIADDRSISLTRTGQQLMRQGITVRYDPKRPSLILYISPAQ